MPCSGHMRLRRPGGVGREEDAAHGVHHSVMLAPRPLSVTLRAKRRAEPHDQDRSQRVRFVVADPHPDVLCRNVHVNPRTVIMRWVDRATRRPTSPGLWRRSGRSGWRLCVRVCHRVGVPDVTLHTGVRCGLRCWPRAGGGVSTLCSGPGFLASAATCGAPWSVVVERRGGGSGGCVLLMTPSWASSRLAA